MWEVSTEPWSRCCWCGLGPQGCILLAAEGAVLKPLNATSSQVFPCARSWKASELCLTTLEPPGANNGLVWYRRAQLHAFRQGRLFVQFMPWAAPYLVRLRRNFTLALFPLLHPLLTPLHVSPEEISQSITQTKISTSVSPSWEPDLRQLLLKIPFILRLEDGTYHLFDIVNAFWNYSKSVEDTGDLDALILSTLKNLAKRLEAISAASSSIHCGTKQSATGVGGDEGQPEGNQILIMQVGNWSLMLWRNSGKRHETCISVFQPGMLGYWSITALAPSVIG